MKKLVCFVLAVLMLTALAVPAFAEPQKMDDSDVTWELLEDNTVLIIGGKGDMPNISAPWWSAQEIITTVIINSGVTSISKSAFSNHKSLTSVTIPSSVTFIGQYAFYTCDKLSSVTFKATTPPTLETRYVFNTNTNNVPALYVPFGKYSDYIKANIWNINKMKSKVSEAYMVDVPYAENGTVMVDNDCFPTSDYTEANETVNITAVPDEGYYLESLVWNDGTNHNLDVAGETSFTMPLNNVTVRAVFAEIGTGSTLSEGNGVIIAAIGAVAVIGAAVVIAKKKKAKN